MFPEVFYELFRGIPRQGPGSNKYTRKAYKLLPGLPERPHILDIGCGSGVQTLELARISGGHVTALDNYQPFLDKLAKEAEAEGLSSKVKAVNGSMFELPFAESTFDLIWSEGAIYILGFEKGLSEWKPLLKPGGCLVVSELAWTRPDRPREIRSYFKNEYPAMKDTAENKKIIRRAGYRLVGNFILPAAVWRKDFYKPMQIRLDEMKLKYAGDQEALEMLDACQLEIDMFKKYSRYYSYVFYLSQQN